jgi:SAM-dependent methyltransferase
MMAESEGSGAVSRVGAGRGAEDFDAVYAGGTPAWDIGKPQPAFAELADAGLLRGQVLDVGCGTGEHALMAAALGLPAVGVDISAGALAIARSKAEQRGLSARFLQGDALELGGFGESFDTALDCGLFHILEDPARPDFVRSLGSCMPAGARYYMLCFSDREPGNWGPRRIRAEEIRLHFAEGWQVVSIQPSWIETTIEPGRVHAWLATISRA